MDTKQNPTNTWGEIAVHRQHSQNHFYGSIRDVENVLFPQKITKSIFCITILPLLHLVPIMGRYIDIYVKDLPTQIQYASAVTGLVPSFFYINFSFAE